MPPHTDVLIAIIDDDDSFRTAMGGLIRSLGYKAAGFSSAEAFLDARSDCHADCLVSDIQMLGMSGIEMKQTLNRDGDTVPVIFVTAQTDAVLGRRVDECGGLLLLHKPFDGQHLIDGIHRALDRFPQSN